MVTTGVIADRSAMYRMIRAIQGWIEYRPMPIMTGSLPSARGSTTPAENHIPNRKPASHTIRRCLASCLNIPSPWCVTTGCSRTRRWFSTAEVTWLLQELRRAGQLHERPFPGYEFPAHKIPTSIAVTTANEFALVTMWDTSTKKGQLAVLALEGKYIPFHTWPYMGMPNQGSWSAFKNLGYIDLPMKAPTSVAAASNGWWSGPSQTGGLVHEPDQAE